MSKDEKSNNPMASTSGADVSDETVELIAGHSNIDDFSKATSKRKRGVLEAYSVDANSDIEEVEFIEGSHEIKKRKQTAGQSNRNNVCLDTFRDEISVSDTTTLIVARGMLAAILKMRSASHENSPGAKPVKKTVTSAMGSKSRKQKVASSPSSLRGDRQETTAEGREPSRAGPESLATKPSKGSIRCRKKAALKAASLAHGADATPGSAFLTQPKWHGLRRSDDGGFVTTINGTDYVITSSQRDDRTHLRKLCRASLKDLQLARTAAGVSANDLKDQGMEFDFKSQISNPRSRAALQKALCAYLGNLEALKQFSDTLSVPEAKANWSSKVVIDNMSQSNRIALGEKVEPYGYDAADFYHFKNTPTDAHLATPLTTDTPTKSATPPGTESVPECDGELDTSLTNKPWKLLPNTKLHVKTKVNGKEPSKILIKKPSKTEEEQDQDFHQMPDVTLREQATSKRKRGVLEAYSVDANSDVVIVEFIEGCHKIKKRKQTADRRPVNPEDRIALGEKVEPYGYDTADFDQFISKSKKKKTFARYLDGDGIRLEKKSEEQKKGTKNSGKFKKGKKW